MFIFVLIKVKFFNKSNYKLMKNLLLFVALLVTCTICFADRPSAESMLRCSQCGSYYVDMVMDHQIPANYICICRSCGHLWSGRLGITKPDE